MTFLSYKYLEEHGFVCSWPKEHNFHCTFSKYNEDITRSICLVSNICPVSSIRHNENYKVWFFGPTSEGGYSTVDTGIVIVTVEELETLMKFLNY